MAAPAILLARAGAKVCVAGRTLKLAQHTVDIITKEGGEAFAHVADVTKEAECRGAVEATMERYGRLDCLDNNVGRNAPGDVTEMSVEQWRNIFALNVDSTTTMSSTRFPRWFRAAVAAPSSTSGACAAFARRNQPFTR